jgi:IclR family acetate operon transcriptional repressor
MKQRSKINQSDPETYESRALAKGLYILEEIASARRPMSLVELAAAAKLGKPSTLRLLRTLVSMGYLVRNGAENYEIEGVWLSARQQLTLRKLRAVARPFLRGLSSQLGETVALAFLFEDHIRVVEVLESPHHIRMSNYQGRILPPYASSLGKAIAAFQSPERIQRLIEVYGIYSFTRHTIVDLGAIAEEFAKVRKQCIALDKEETVQGGICFGAPVTVKEEEVVASISVSMPCVRLSDRLENSLPFLVQETASQISAEFQRGDP